MNAEQTLGVAYLKARPSDPWRWAENGEVLTWRDGTTVAFRAEILQILRALAPQRLPPFGSVVFLLAACRGKLPTFAEVFPAAASLDQGPSGQMLRVLGRSPASLFDDSVKELGRVSALPEGLRTSLRAKQALAEAVLESVLPDHRSFRLRVSESLFHGTGSLDRSLSEDDGGQDLQRQIEILASGLRGLTQEGLALRIRTGLERLPAAAEGLELPPAVRARLLLDQLLSTSEHRAMALAARQMMAAAQLPRYLHAREELAVGGVAGLSNRGSLDRLLLSELAHDDMTLATRVALNEALYLHEEPPEYQPPLTRCLILDAGIRLWGLPRLFATSSALALAAADLRTSVLRAWRSSGDQLIPVDLLSAEGLAEHLSVLDTALHPGAALRALDKILGPRDSTQAILITHPCTLADPEFQRALLACRRPLDFICTVDRAGNCVFHEAPFHGGSVIRESQLDVASLFPQVSGKTASRSELSSRELPAFLKASPTPFLLPLAGRADVWFQPSETRCVAALSDRRLVEYHPGNHHVGGRLLAPRLPSGRRLWAGEVEGNIYLVHAGSARRPNRWVRVGRDGVIDTLDLCGGEPASAVICQDRVLLVAREHEVFAYDLLTGQALDRAPSPSRWHRGRYFSSLQQFHAMHWDGRRIEFIPVKLPMQVGVSSLVALFDREGFEGPWVLTQMCQAMSLDGAHKVQIPLPIGQSSHLRHVHVSRDGHRVFLSIPTLSWTQLFDLKEGRPIAHASAEAGMELLDAGPTIPTHPLLKSVEDVTLYQGELCLRTRKSDCFLVQAGPDSSLRLVPLEGVEPSGWWPAEELPLGYPAAHAFTLRAARSPQGGQVILDSRGLLHLKGAPGETREVTLALSPGRLAVWANGGAMGGPSFFIPPEVQAAPAEELLRHYTDCLSQL